jgi:hypothetical protein
MNIMNKLREISKTNKMVKEDLNPTYLAYAVDSYLYAVSIKNKKEKFLDTSELYPTSMIVANYSENDLKTLYNYSKDPLTKKTNLISHMKDKPAIEKMKKEKMEIICSDGSGNYYLLSKDLKIYDWDHNLPVQLRAGKSFDEFIEGFVKRLDKYEIYVIEQLKRGVAPEDIPREYMNK